MRPVAWPRHLPTAWGLSALLAAGAVPAQAPDPQAAEPDRTESGRAQLDPVQLDRVQVLGQTQPLSRFPGAVTVLDAAALGDGQRQQSLAESLQRAPGVLALERHNFAQDLQVQSRGFGARSTFGIRGISLVVNGIPASALDGQGQAATFALGALDRVQVLRGPLALVHGNGAGGAIRGDSVLDGQNSWRTSGWRGAHGSQRQALRLDAASKDDAWRWRLHGSRFATDGHRPHAAARVHHAGAVAHHVSDGAAQLRLVLDVLQQPWTQDPLGLTRSQWQIDPFGTDPAALQFNSRKRVDNRQAGLHWSQHVAGGGELWLSAYGVQRQMQQFLAIPAGAQMPPTSAGGMIDLGRHSVGLGIGHRMALGTGSLALGLDAGRLTEDRRGHENFIGNASGVRGRLRRDERNRITSIEPWAAWEQPLDEDWRLLVAARHGRMRFDSRDAYIAPGNPDDSGHLRFSETAAALGVARQWLHGEAWASLGQGFETPTITELAYRPDGEGGFNTGLRPARFGSGEAGLRWRGQAGSGSLALYRIEGRHEIVPALSSGGRASFTNAGRTRREGVEVSLQGELGATLSWQLTGNAIRARFVETWHGTVSRSGTHEVRTVPAGHRVPGIPSLHGFGELAWHDPARRWAVALEAVGNSAIAVDDGNNDHAPGHLRLNLAARWRSADMAGWHGFVRIDNLGNRRAIGSVIVNEANGRHFEPMPARGLTIGMGWTATPH